MRREKFTSGWGLRSGGDSGDPIERLFADPPVSRGLRDSYNRWTIGDWNGRRITILNHPCVIRSAGVRISLEYQNRYLAPDQL